eukprot:TRINITY_DN10744_c0_g1_i1.p1 TRINITY_DN10744_c0_g1~~TRINITY_DN10744_c0_g1_i1.p1  ORF type:complete len:181 (-),score=30.84 TRINITY_DN10744_c0_g1_i1:61-603(-)
MFDNEDEELGFEVALQKLEDNWFNKAAILRTHLISPIHDASAKGNLERLKFLVEVEKADVNQVDSTNNTPLHWAAGAGHVEAVQYLIHSGCDLNKQNLLGDTPLHRAVWRNQLSTVKILLQSGVDHNILNRDGKYAIDLVRDVSVGAALQSFIPKEKEDNIGMPIFTEDSKESDSDSDTD